MIRNAWSDPARQAAIRARQARAQAKVAETLKDRFKDLSDDDLRAALAGPSGRTRLQSGAIRSELLRRRKGK